MADPGFKIPDFLTQQDDPVFREREEDLERARKQATERMRGTSERETADLTERDLRLAEKVKDAPQLGTMKRAEPFQPAEMNTQDIQQFGGMAMAFAALASLATRRPMLNALNASASALNGFKQGHLERAKTDLQTYKTNMDAALANNDMMWREYEAKMQSNRLDIESERILMQAVGRKYGHEALLAKLELGDINSARDLLYKNRDHSEALKLRAMQFWGTMENQAANREARQEAARESAAARRQAHQDRLLTLDMQYGTDFSGMNANGQKPGAPSEKEQEAAKALDGLIRMVADDPSLVGPYSRVRQIWEGVAPALENARSVPLIGPAVSSVARKLAPGDSKAQKFVSELSRVQAQIHQSIVGGGPMTKLKYDYINTVMRGRGLMDSPDAAIDSWRQVQSVLDPTHYKRGAPDATERSSTTEGKDAAAYPDMVMESGGKKYLSRGGQWVEIKSPSRATDW